ncbi:MAG: rhomboid family intramembrane serine protease [Propioniciclava sp.]
MSSSTATQRQHPITGRPSLAGATLVMVVGLGVLWLLEVIDVAVPALKLDLWGISPRELDELPQLLTAPLIHSGFDHLVANSVPFFVLGLVILLSGLRGFITATLCSVIASGMVVWLIAPANSVTVGASGLVFGWLTFVLARGFFTRRWSHLVLGVAAFVVYGGILWGVLPSAAEVSWQAHAGGAIGGLLAARWLRPTPTVRT